MKYPGKEELLRNLALRVKELRKIKDVTQEEALHDTGIQFSRIEQGKRDVQLSTILKLCHYFEISMTDFLTTLLINEQLAIYNVQFGALVHN